MCQIRRIVIVLGAVSFFAVAAKSTNAQTKRIQDVVYGRKHGMALTMDVFQPKKQNGGAVVYVVSGGWFSAHRAINPTYAKPFLDRGYTVFAVVHGSQPKFNIQEILVDMNRSVRFIRFHAKKYKIDSNRIGITGGSAGGHLSLMIGMAGKNGSKMAKDPIDRVSSRVQAVACFFPPTDFLNYGKEGENAVGRGVLKNFQAPFAFSNYDKKTRSFQLITDDKKRSDIGRMISPVYHVSKDDPATLIIHGDADKLVPIQQAELIVAKLKDANVTAKLIVKEKAAHGWPMLLQDLDHFVAWFDKHLK